MRVLVDFWCSLTPRARVLSWTGWTLTLSVFAFGWLICATGHERESVLLQREANRQLWSSLYPFVSVEDPRLMAGRASATPFSPLAIAVPGLQLRRWQPSAQGGELVLRAEWQAVPALFAHLAERGVSVSGFALHKEQDALLLTVTLEPRHD